MELTEERKAEIAAEVRAVHDQFWDVWKDMDVDRGMAYYYNAPELVFGMDGQVLWGWDQGMAMSQSFAATASGQLMDFAESRIVVLSPDVVYVTDQGMRAVVDTAGVAGPSMPFAFTAVWVLRDGEWKVHGAHGSHSLPQVP